MAPMADSVSVAIRPRSTRLTNYANSLAAGFHFRRYIL